jgi:ABC-type branched-subunit amino acid transport system substrate-binding protein
MKDFNRNLKYGFFYIYDNYNYKNILSLVIIIAISSFLILIAGFNNFSGCYGYGASLSNNAGIKNTVHKNKNLEIKNNSVNIAVIVPKNGRYKYFGKQFLDGILFSIQKNKKANIKFIIVSLPFNAGRGSIKNLFKSIDKKNISAIIGPLFVSQIAYFSKYSSIYKIPVFTPAPLNFSKDKSPYLFHYGMTVKNEVSADLQYAETKGIDKISVIYPDNAYGKKTIQYINAIGSKLGINIVDETAYEKHTVDFFYNFNLLVRFQDMGHGHMTKAEENQLGVTPYNLMHGITKAKPYIPFGGLFLIGSTGKLKLILTQLAYYNITGIKLFGLSQIDNKKFLNKYSFYMQGIVYPGGFLPDSRNKFVKNFVKSYKNYYNEKPNILSAEGYDMGNIVIKSIMMRSGSNAYESIKNSIQANGGINNNRQLLYRSLLKFKSFKGVCGISHIRGRDFIKGLYLFQLKNNKIYIIRSPFN